jgi:hypothetical protein
MIQEAETTGQIALLGTRSSAKYSKRDSTSKIPIEVNHFLAMIFINSDTHLLGSRKLVN